MTALGQGRRRIVISGLGVVSPYGAGVKPFWTGLSAGTCAIKPATLVETDGFRSRLAAEVPPDVMAGLPASRRRSRADRLALTAAAEALADADLSARDQRAAALAVGAVGGGMYEGEEWYWEEVRTGRPSPKIGALRSILPFSHAERLGSRLGLTGPRETLVMACASGAASIALGADLISEGVVEAALCGGVDALTRICFMGFNSLRLLDPEPCRPFDRDRRGMSIGEAAAFLVLEDAEHCRARGGRAYASLLGTAMTTDAHHVTAPHPEGEGMIRAMRLALEAAGLAAEAVGYVNAHGTGTLQNDRTESLALRRVFGEGRVLVSSTKSLVGHTMAAAGSVEAIATVLGLQHGLLPPTANLVNTDPDVPFDCIAREARAAAVAVALSNSFGFGGQNVSLIFGRGES
ncbi:MAG TPA: beta-ketoacyl-[acyl-carrier-protein] synthase family protein [Methylomirabilota bacterium]|jgi:3-oxoacyl-[acyl-carrier-protein] synthase II|nr:beta-ketoacyl-[acyl-carrier-protein] synthase family protein [Methylomirabilota bacterium]